MHRITVATSIAPKGIEKQKKAISSWIQSGLDVISCNTVEEIAVLQEEFPEVSFEPMQRSGKSLVGRELPYISDLMKVLSEKSNGISGIINSDIFLSELPLNCIDVIKREAENSLLFCRRQEIDDYSDIHELNFCMETTGIDTFFFDQNMIQCIEEENLFLGAGSWDTWMIICANMNNIAIKELINPVTFHLKHPIYWNMEIAEILADQLMKKHFPSLGHHEKGIQVLPHMFCEILANKIKTICCSNHEVFWKKVGVYCKDSVLLEEQIEKQTYKNIEIVDNNDWSKNQECDYILECPDNIVLSEVCIEMLIQVMTQFGVKGLKCYTYILEVNNRKKIFSTFNSGYQYDNTFNSQIEQVTIYAKEEKQKEKKILRLPLSFIEMQHGNTEIHCKQSLQGKVYLYPAGYRAKEWLLKNHDMPGVKIVGFCDKNEQKWGNKIFGKEVYGPERLIKDNNYDYVLVISDFYEKEICEELRKKISEDKILRLTDCFESYEIEAREILNNPEIWIEQNEEEQKLKGRLRQLIDYLEQSDGGELKKEVAHIKSRIHKAKTVCTFGTENLWDNAVYILDRIDITCTFNSREWGKEKENIKCISPEELIQIDDVVVIITDYNWKETAEYLDRNGIEHYSYVETLGATIEFKCDGGLITEQKKEIIKAFELLVDNESREVFIETIANATAPQFRRKRYWEICDPIQYFSGKYVKLQEDECFVDGGAFIGDTVTSFIETSHNKFEQIYAFELDKRNYHCLEKNIKHRNDKSKIQIENCGLWDTDETISYGGENGDVRIGGGIVIGHAKKLDDILKDKKVTFIKMDIEGAEIRALQGAEEIIRKQAPKMAICVYHDLSHYWKIPLMLHDMCPNYNIAMEHHASLYWETVCYAY